MQWHKTFNYEWLTGSIRKDLTAAGRGVWADVLATVGLSRRQGYLERGHGVPWTLEELAAYWNTPLHEVQIAFAACIKEGRIKRLADGTYFVTNFETYQKKGERKNNNNGDNKYKDEKIIYSLLSKNPEIADRIAIDRIKFIQNEINSTKDSG